jgi:sialate O-acetylesterase
MNTVSRLALAALPLLSLTAARADVVPSALFVDNAVLQRDHAIPVWGTADPSEKVTVTLGAKTASTVTGADGHWRVSLAPLPAGGPFPLVIAGKNTVTLKNVLLGDVWICSGQSNMQYSMRYKRGYYTADIAAADDPQLRCFAVANKTSPVPLADLLPTNPTQQVWQATTPKTVIEFSTVGYYFGRELRKALGVPIGLINTAWGGTNGESWVSREALSADPELKTLADTQIRAMEAFPAEHERLPSLTEAWEAKYAAKDIGDTGEAMGWAKPEFNDSGWKTAKVPLNFSQLGMKSGGSVWFRKTLDFPAAAAGKAFVWNLNWSPDDYVGYFNGVKLTAPRGEAQEKFFNGPRSFMIPAGLVHAGANTFALRIYSHTYGGYLFPATTRMSLPITTFAEDAEQWKFQIERENPPISREGLAALPKSPDAVPQNTATYIYNAQIAPLMPFAFKGVIWYQGENNSQRALQYRKILPALIGDWRGRWGEGDFPFYIVQLANYGRVATEPGRSAWAELREAQLLTAEKVPNTGLAVTSDIGEGDNIHPKNKQDVGKRLALVALAKTYGEKVAYSGPLYLGMTVTGDKAQLRFSQVDGGLVAKGGPLKYFAVAGADNKFVWADAQISGDTVIVSSSQVAHPVSVRYAWADNPEGANLYNAAGLPASPFRTNLNDGDVVAAPAVPTVPAVPVVPAAGLKKSGVLLNGDFSSPAVPADKNYVVAHADGWTYDVHNSGPVVGVMGWKKDRPPFLLWNGPDGTISQIADVKTSPVARVGSVYTLSYLYGGQGKGAYTLVASILIDGKPAVSDTKDVDVHKPGIDRTGMLTYTVKAVDVGKSIGVSFMMTKDGTDVVQSALTDISLTVAPSAGK